MAKAVFRPVEVALTGSRVVLDPPHAFPGMAHLAPVEDSGEAPEEAAIEVYAGPTAEDLRREAEAFKVQWEREREALIGSAKAEAESVIKEARAAAQLELKQRVEEAESLRREAGEEAERIIAEAREKAKQTEADSLAAFEKGRKEAEDQGRLEGHEAGFAAGTEEASRLVERVRTILERAQDRRAEILAETEQQIIDLVLLISRKVVKTISGEQRGVVIDNVIGALRKVKDRGNISIKVNLADLKLSTEHTREFIKEVEGAKSLQILEDSTVDPGGCVIETDYGEIDARIASQLAELEAKILELVPIKSRARGI